MIQKRVNIYCGMGVAGGHASTNPIISLPLGRMALVDTPIGGFCWDSDVDGFVVPYGEGKPLGFVHRDVIYDCYCPAANYVPAKRNADIAVRGDFYVDVPNGCEKGDKVFACLTDGTVAGGKAGAEIAGYVETDYVFQNSADYGQSAIISNWVSAGTTSGAEPTKVSDIDELLDAINDDTVTNIELEADISSTDDFVIELNSGVKTLDLAGHVLSAESTADAVAVVKVNTGATINIKDSNGIGTVEATTGDSNMAVWVAGGVANLYGGNYTAKNSSTIYSADGGVINIYGGYYEVTGDDHDAMAVLNIKNYTNSHIYCYGGEYKGQNPADGDDVDKESGATFLADGCTVTEEEKDGFIYYTVK